MVAGRNTRLEIMKRWQRATNDVIRLNFFFFRLKYQNYTRDIPLLKYSASVKIHRQTLRIRAFKLVASRGLCKSRFVLNLLWKLRSRVHFIHTRIVDQEHFVWLWNISKKRRHVLTAQDQRLVSFFLNNCENEIRNHSPLSTFHFFHFP